MAVLQILKMGHPLLRKKASKVENFEDVLSVTKSIFENVKSTC